MSRLADLIAQLCPDGVEYRALGDVGVFVRGGGLQKADFVEAGMPCVHYGQIHTRFGTSTTTAISSVSEAQFARLKHAEYGDLLIATTSEDDEAVGKATAWLGDGEVAISGDMFYYRHNLEPKYVSYFFASSSFQEQKRPYLTGAKVRRIADKGLSRIQIPVPPVEIQREIVRILDQFTTLEAELEAELEARRTQYEHYRNHLLSYDSLAARGPVSWIPLRELGVWSGGGTPSKSRADYWDEGNIPWITPKDMRSSTIQNSMINVTDRAVRESNVKLIEAPSIALVVRSSILQHTFPVAQIDVDATFNQDMKTLVVDSDRFERRYIYYALSANGQEILRQTSKQGGSVNSLVVPRLMDYETPVPALDEQQRIADLLDRFDALVNDITSGLPAEIAARRAQYEHYRDRLLSFPEKAVSRSNAS